MTISIHPQSLKFHRKRRGWTQQQLSDATQGPNKVSLPTIKRIESTKKGTYAANNRVAETLAKALGASVDDLSKAPSQKAPSQKESREEFMRAVYGYRPLRTVIEPETNFAFRMVEDLYGISRQSQIEMAPLFTALLVNGSLAWRRKRLESMEEAAKDLNKLTSGKKYGHFGFTKAAEEEWRKGIDYERDSIDYSDLFGARLEEKATESGRGRDWGEDPASYLNSPPNPFADYLSEFAKEVEEDKISLISVGNFNKTHEGLPWYEIGGNYVDQLTMGEYEALYPLLCGYVHIKDIPDELLADDKADERIAWLSSHAPEGEIDAMFARQREEFGTEDYIDPSEKEAQFQAEEKGEEDE